MIPYHDSSSGELVNLTKYDFTWTTTKLTEYELEIQLNFTEPDSISRQKIYDQIQISFNVSYKLIFSAETGKTLDISSRVLISDIPPQTLKTQAAEMLQSTTNLT